MTSITEIARMLDTRVLYPRSRNDGGEIEVARAVASDRMSDLLERASATTLIVTSLATPQLLDMAELMDVPAVCISARPGEDRRLLETASQCRAAVIVSDLGLEELRRRLADLLAAEADPPP